MSAEVPTPNAEKPPARPRVSNRRQMLLFVALTLILTVATVWGGRVWLRNSESLVFAAGDANGAEARFAEKLASVLNNNPSKLRLKIVTNPDSGKALAQFDRRQADLAVLRTDTKVPPRARALAILEHDVVLLLSPPNKKIKSLAELKKKKIAVLADGDHNAAFVRKMLEISDNSDAASAVQLAPPNSPFDKLFAPGGYGASIARELARTIYENKAELALPDGFASRIEPADTDKDAFVVAHQGAAEYINDDTKSFMDRYSDLLYLAAAALSIIGSIFAGLYAKVTRIAPEKASELATAILDIGERIEHATSMDALDALQEELEQILRGVVIGLRDGTVSSDGLDTFKLGYEFVRDEIGMRRESLKRHAGHDDNVVVVKTAQSA